MTDESNNAESNNPDTFEHSIVGRRNTAMMKIALQLASVGFVLAVREATSALNQFTIGLNKLPSIPPRWYHLSKHSKRRRIRKKYSDRINRLLTG